GYAARAAAGGYAAQAADEGYAAHAASGSGRGRVASPRTRDEFKEYAMALRNRDRRGRGDEGGSRERASGKSHREKGYARESRSSADERSLSRYLPGDLPPSRQRRSSGRGSPDSARHGSRGRGGTRERERERPFKADERPADKYGRPESRSRREPSPRTSDRGGGRGGGRGDRRGGRDREFSPPSHGSESSGRGRGGRGKPRPGAPDRSKKARYEDGGGDRQGGEENYDYERFTGAALHEGHEAFAGPRPAEGPARPQHLQRNHGPGGGGRGGRGGRGRGGMDFDDPMDDPEFQPPYERGAGRGRGRRGDMSAPAGRGGRGGV
ncbi:unnamed protein product, partial [Scytosiphon promiscuus]